LKALETTGSAITYTTAANHIATAVSELPEAISRNTRNISSVAQADSGDRQSGTGIYNDDESIKTGHIHEWKSLPLEDRKAVIGERKRLGIQFKKKGGSKTGGGGRNAADINRLKQLEEKNSKYKRTIKALKRNYGTNDEIEDERMDAGDQSGCRNAKKRAKKGINSEKLWGPSFEMAHEN